MKKIYHVIMQDEWNILYSQGHFSSLDSDLLMAYINGFISQYTDLEVKKGALREYPSSFNMAFDANVADLLELDECDNEELYAELSNILVRGFIHQVDDNVFDYLKRNNLID